MEWGGDWLYRSRAHVHAKCGDGEAKFWLEPSVELAKNIGLSAQQVSEIRKVIEERRDELDFAWRQHFG